jgi:hypothetical protein
MWLKCEVAEHILPKDYIVRLMAENEVNLITKVRPSERILYPFDAIGYVSDHKIEDDELWLETPMLRYESKEVPIMVKPYLIGFTVGWPPRMHIVCFYVV